MIGRRAFVGGVAAMLGAPLAGEAQPRNANAPARLPRVGYLGSGHPSDRSSRRFAHLFRAFTNGLRDVGYVEGETVTVDYRFVEERYERFVDLARELVRLGVDVIFAPSDRAAAAAKQVTQTIPIVFAAAADPVASQFVASFSRPSRNMTGLTQAGTQLTGKRLSLLKESIPKLSKVAVLWNPTAQRAVDHLSVAQDSARTLRVQSKTFGMRGPQDLEGVFTAMVSEGAQAVLLLPDSIIYIAYEQLGSRALRHRLPMIGSRAEYAHAGALMSYGPSLIAEWRRAGALVGKILSGAKPADLPVEEPSTFELVINLKTAKALGLTIPPSLLLRADQVIE